MKSVLAEDWGFILAPDGGLRTGRVDKNSGILEGSFF